MNSLDKYMNTLDSYFGCLIGLAIGDAVGMKLFH